ncbi:MAG: TonB-dependent receptor [Acidobacteria bacterium]|nr:MAG: TonB-dependent receptor [Acidobacteriota bacterium]
MTRFVLSGMALAVVTAGLPAIAQEADDSDASEQAAEAAQEPVAEEPFSEEIIVTGTRKEGLVPTETLSPIDVLPAELIADQANFDLTDGISRIAPSFNTQRFPIADGTAFIRPVTLRNLSPDHTLVLVNGTRRHRSALVNLQLAPLGTVNQGSQAVDFSTLPAAAIERIEVLRDGASAQYGSDAIAGVVNVILKDAPDGRSLSVQSGEYYEGDGARTTVSGNAGFGVGETGFLNASFEYSTSDKTSRGVARPDAAFVASIVGADQTPLNGLGQRWGDPDVEVWKAFVNFGIDVSDSAEIYSFVSYADNETVSDFFYRGPVLDPVHMFTARSTLQQDLDGDFLPDPAPQSLVDDIIARGLNPADFLVADPSSPSGFVLRNPIFTRFPGGYNPNFGANITDLAWVFGAKGGTGGGLRWDVRGRVAENEVEYTLSESINPSLGALSPTEFRPGTLTQEESSINADFVKLFDVGSLASPLNLAFGFEYRDETYKIGAGDPASREVGPTAAIFGLGSDGFQGFPIESAGRFSSESFATYLDVEADLSDRFSGGIALRYEDYDVFGSTFDWKLSARFEVSDQFALRGTANTGFRAPTPGQVNTLNVTTSADSQGNLIPSGVYPVDHPVARALGSVPLEPEDSTSFTVGFVAKPSPSTSVTLDVYDIEIENRLALQNNTITADDVPRLRDAGVANPELLVNSLANFFSNAFDSDITGVDVAVVKHFQIADGLLTVDFRHNYNKQEVSNVAPGTINESRVFDLENQVPKHRSNLTVNYDSGKRFAGYIRANRYGSWKSTGGLFSPGDASDASTYGSEILFDLEVRWKFADHYGVAIGGENIFDTLPDPEQDPVLQFLGVFHSLTSPFGFNGGQWYVRLGLDF